MYEINLCSPIYNEMQDHSVNLRVTRILFGIDLLLLCLAYNGISFLLKKDINSLRLEDKESNQAKIQSLERLYKVIGLKTRNGRMSFCSLSGTMWSQSASL